MRGVIKAKIIINKIYIEPKRDNLLEINLESTNLTLILSALRLGDSTAVLLAATAISSSSVVVNVYLASFTTTAPAVYKPHNRTAVRITGT